MLSARAWWFGAFAWTIAKCVLVNNIFPKGTSKKLAKRRSERRRRLTKVAGGSRSDLTIIGRRRERHVVLLVSLATTSFLQAKAKS